MNEQFSELLRLVWYLLAACIPSAESIFLFSDVKSVAHYHIGWVGRPLELEFSHSVRCLRLGRHLRLWRCVKYWYRVLLSSRKLILVLL